MKFLRYSGLLILLMLIACSGQTGTTGTVPANLPSHRVASITPTSTPSPTSTNENFFPSDRLRMAYEVDGNLFFKNGGSTALQLTDSGKDQRPVFSDDGEKIVFYRGGFLDDRYKNVYSVNSEGGREHPLVTASALIALNLGYSESSETNIFQFIPGTHQLLFNTHEIDPQPGDYSDFTENQDLLFVDSDTGEMRQILPPGKGGPFKISPDGKLVEIVGADHIDVIGIDGQIRFGNLLTYPTVHSPSGEGIDWTQDAGELIVSLPIITWVAIDLTGPMPTIFQKYSMGEGRLTAELKFNPMPLRGSYAISPDGNWILYTYYDYYGMADESTPEGVCLGNMRDGVSRVYDPSGDYRCYSIYWGSGSDYFMCQESEGWTVGNADGTSRNINGEEFLGWADALHFYYLRDDIIWMEDVRGEEILSLAEYPAGVKYLSQIDFFYEA